MPKLFDNILQFKHYNHSLKVPFVAYVDFECMLQKIQTYQPSDERPYTNAYQRHTPNNFAYYIKYCNEDYKPHVEYSEMDAAKVFYEKIKEDALYIAKEYYDKAKQLAEKKRLNLKPATSAKDLLMPYHQC